MAAWLGAVQQLPLSLVLATVMVAGAGLADDVRGGLPPVFRLAVQLLAAILVTGSCGPIERLPLPDPAALPLNWAGYPLTLLWLVGVTNIYNFLDGIDGFAAVQGLAAGLALGFAAGGGPEAQVALSLAGGCAGFLLHNWHPARIFLGDVGSAALGFLFAALPLYAAREGAERAELVWLAALALWFFLADGAFTLCRRAWRGERVWEPHRSHLYQRLVQSGWTHARVALTVGLATGVLAASALAARWFPGVGARWSVTGMAVFGFGVYWAGVAWRERGAGGRQPKEAASSR